MISACPLPNQCHPVLYIILPKKGKITTYVYGNLMRGKRFHNDPLVSILQDL